MPIFAKSDGDGDNGEEEQDWRAFRAKLVMSEGATPASSGDAGIESEVATTGVSGGESDGDDVDGIGSLFAEAESPRRYTSSSLTPLDPSQWAYDSGSVIERGAVILGGVEQDFGFGLRQQYFHKSVMLVLDHDEGTFTRGIILNRPSDRTVDDDVNDGLRWRVWFGGDVQGLDSASPEIVCLHSLKSEEARDASVTVMKDIQVSSSNLSSLLIVEPAPAGDVKW